MPYRHTYSKAVVDSLPKGADKAAWQEIEGEERVEATEEPSSPPAPRKRGRPAKRR